MREKRARCPCCRRTTKQPKQALKCMARGLEYDWRRQRIGYGGGMDKRGVGKMKVALRKRETERARGFFI